MDWHYEPTLYLRGEDGHMFPFTLEVRGWHTDMEGDHPGIPVARVNGCLLRCKVDPTADIWDTTGDLYHTASALVAYFYEGGTIGDMCEIGSVLTTLFIEFAAIAPVFRGVGLAGCLLSWLETALGCSYDVCALLALIPTPLQWCGRWGDEHADLIGDLRRSPTELADKVAVRDAWRRAGVAHEVGADLLVRPGGHMWPETATASPLHWPQPREDVDLSALSPLVPLSEETDG